MTLEQGYARAPVEGGYIGYAVAGWGPVVATTHPYTMPPVDAAHSGIPGTTSVTVWGRGFQPSSPVRDRSDFGFWQLADDLDAVRGHLGLEKWVFWGVSMGAFTGLVYALKYQETLHGLILDSGAASHQYRDDPDSIWPELRASKESTNYHSDPGPENQAAFWRKIGELMEAATPPGARRPAQPWAPGDMPLEALTEIISTIERFDTRPRLNEIHMPTLILAGDRDPQCPPSQSRVIAEGIVGSVLKIFPDTGHGVIRHNPPGALETVQEFIRSAGSTAAS